MLIKQREIPELWSKLAGLPPILQRIYAARGISDESQLDKRLETLLPFHTLSDINKACQRLEQALINNERILIIGDFDADGATSTVLGICALQAMGAVNVNYLVPNRFEFGYGLTPGLVNMAQKWQPNLIITVDNGISSIEGVNAANKAGIDVLITDHHLQGDVLPKAIAIVNPNQKGDNFLSKSIAGVGVIFYVMIALRRHLVNCGWFEKQKLTLPNMAQFLDLVALGTIADVVPLDQNNRILVNQGLMRIRQGLCRQGIKALINIADKNISRISETDLGFAIGPRLNAAGRLDDMSLGIECLLSEDMARALKLATQLDELNKTRRLIEIQMKEQAFTLIDKFSQKLDCQSLPLALCLLDKSWHQGVIGILAGRLKERYHRPVIAFAQVSEHELKGSARSVQFLNIRDVLAAVDKDNPGLITKFGGHAMAAGLSLPVQNFASFQQAFIAEVAFYIDGSESMQLLTDGPLNALDINLKTAALLQEAGPWGQQFPEPCFQNDFEIISQRLVGQAHLKLILKHIDGEEFIDAIAFFVDLDSWPNYRAQRIHAAYKLDINIYKERARLQLIIQNMQVL